MVLVEFGQVFYELLGSVTIIIPGFFNLILSFIFSFAITRDLKQVMILMLPMAILWGFAGAAHNFFIIMVLGIICASGIFMEISQSKMMEVNRKTMPGKTSKFFKSQPSEVREVKSKHIPGTPSLDFLGVFKKGFD